MKLKDTPRRRRLIAYLLVSGAVMLAVERIHDSIGLLDRAIRKAAELLADNEPTTEQTT